MSRKRTALEGTNLVLPWRPLYDLFQSTYFTGSRSRAYVDEKYAWRASRPAHYPNLAR